MAGTMATLAASLFFRDTSFLSNKGVTAFAVVGGVAGAAWAGYATYTNAKSRFESGESARVEATHGPAIAQVAKDLITPFDHSGDGSIQLVNNTGLPGRDEVVRVESRRGSSSRPEFDLLGNRTGTTRSHVTVEERTSARPLWDAANADGDTVVKPAELEALLRTFDANASGTLETPERARFEAAHPMLREVTRR